MQRSNTGGQHSFASIPSANIQRSRLDRSCGLKTTMDTGVITPIFADEILPGDTMNMNLSRFARMATPLHPVLENIFMDVQWWFIPMRLLWTNWERFNGAQDDPGDSTDFVIPEMVSDGTTGHLVGSLSDYLGIPPKIKDLTHSAMFHRAYALTYNTWYRDENLQDRTPFSNDDGPDDPDDYPLMQRGKRYDYFTSALPFALKGDPVTLPLGTTAPVISAGDGVPSFNIGGQVSVSMDSEGTNGMQWGGPTGTDTDATWNSTKLQADLTNASAATVNAIREAVAIQHLYERDARGGTRYTEIVLSHFGVRSEDSRLQRPEYLGGDTSRVNFNPVAQTAQGFDSGTSGTVQGNLAAFATSSSQGRGFNRSFTEHGIILGLCSVRADLNYQQGLPRMFSRSTRFDFYLPDLAHLGEQAIKNKEIFAQGSDDATADEETFGFQERWAEMRYRPSQVTAQMRSAAGTSLDTWHLAQDFPSLPLLNSSFIVEDPPMIRIMAVNDEPEWLLDCYFDYSCVRPMPVYSIPGLKRF